MPVGVFGADQGKLRILTDGQYEKAKGSRPKAKGRFSPTEKAIIVFREKFM